VAWAVERWGTLPNVGGYLDQEYKLMKRMTVLSNVYGAITTFDRHMDINISGKRGPHTIPKGVGRIYKSLMDEGIV
jgi:hypothetical protein